MFTIFNRFSNSCTTLLISLKVQIESVTNNSQINLAKNGVLTEGQAVERKNSLPNSVPLVKFENSRLGDAESNSVIKMHV